MKKWTNELNRTFSKEEIQMVKPHEEMCQILGHMEMQIKITVRFHLIPVRMAVIKNTNNKCCLGCREKGTLIHCW
jgi:hypothetical protein